MCVCVCVCAYGLEGGGGREGAWRVCGGRGKHQGELACERQASRQAYGLLITQGLPPPLGAVSNMREHNQPLKNTGPTQSTTGRVRGGLPMHLCARPEMTFDDVSSGVLILCRKTEHASLLET